ncbi:hypothetical protein [Streptomyces gibsoniae]|uniref:Secreted protein n=1 Tax=Streptomyces gibsoniae TaxID=3075529 RepID=A0ABU2UA43_9ACTN|nr:hypothetical protein [Streptomyces sp. DSM 41699]MDT0470105.1 hypothetical protein [Streptomyces sp. DSM 41699]
MRTLKSVGIAAASAALLLAPVTAAGAADLEPSAHQTNSRSATAAGWSCRDTSSTITGAKVTAHICWNGTKVSASGRIYDTKADHHKACVKVHYVTRNGVGTWLAKCDENGAGTSTAWSHGEPYGKNYWIKACTNNWTGTKCDAHWR